MLEYDLIRLLIAFICGAMLSLAGSLVQGVTQNELAGPATLGLNAVSVLVILVTHLILTYFPQLGSLEHISIILFFVTVALISLFFKSKWSQSFNGVSEGTTNFLLLLGLCFNLFVGAVFAILQFFFITLNLNFPSQLWFGNFRFFDLSMVIILLITFVVLYFLSYQLRVKIRAISFGPEVAQSLGLEIWPLQLRALLIALIGVGVVNCLFGVFAFMGLLFPHLLRGLAPFKKNMSLEISIGPFIAGILFAILDQFCNWVQFSGAEIPVGMVSSLIGTFFLMVLLIRKARTL